MEIEERLKRRLLIITADFGPGGAQPMTLRLAGELRDRGHIVRVVSLFPRPDAVQAGMLTGLDVVRLNAHGLLQRARLPIRLARIARQYDLVIGGSEHAPTTYGYLACVLARKPFVSWTHIALSKRIVDEHAPIHSSALMMVYRRLSYIVFPSQGALHDARNLLGKRRQIPALFAIPNFFDRVTPQDTEIAFPDTAIFSKPVLLGAGRFHSQKAFDRLIRTHASLRRRGLDHHLVILGDGPLRPSLEAEARELGVQDTVFMPGYRNNVVTWMSRATVFALCSHYEGFALVILEALAAGTPAVAMNCPSGPAEILDGGKYGLLTPPDDESAFAEAIARIFEDEGLRR